MRQLGAMFGGSTGPKLTLGARTGRPTASWGKPTAPLHNRQDFRRTPLDNEVDRSRRKGRAKAERKVSR